MAGTLTELKWYLQMRVRLKKAFCVLSHSSGFSYASMLHQHSYEKKSRIKRENVLLATE